MKVEIDLPEIEGYEYTGDYRKPNPGEHVAWGVCGCAFKAYEYSEQPESCFILRKKRWRAEQGERYWFLNARLMVERMIEFRDEFDDELFKIGNYFQTKEEAEAIAEKVRALFEGGL